MRKTFQGVLLVLTVVVATVSWAGAALAQSSTDSGKKKSIESPRNMIFEIKFGGFVPDVDKEFNGAKTPYADIFGSSMKLMSQAELDWDVFDSFGVISIGGTIGYSKTSGTGVLEDGEKSEDSTSFHILPLALTVGYRFDWAARKYDVPLVPWVKGGLDYYIWWVTNGTGDVTRSEDGTVGRGGTFGGHVTFGLGFLLDSIAPLMAQSFDTDVGVNGTYIFGEYVLSWVDDFGSSNSFDLSSRYFLVGLAFEF